MSVGRLPVISIVNKLFIDILDTLNTPVSSFIKKSKFGVPK